MKKSIKVGMADMNVCCSPDSLVTLGLGSCVGIVLYDPKQKIAGLAHIMLPDSEKIMNNSNKAKFADTGVDITIEAMLKIGAKRKNLIAKIAGGAQMFAFKTNNEMMRVGERNVKATKAKLKKENIRIVAEDTGANYGRTIEFFPENGELHIRSHGKKIKII